LQLTNVELEIAMPTTRLNRRIALCVAAIALPGAALAQAATLQGEFERAMADYAQRNYAAAHQALWVLADKGHAESARIALLMAAHGQQRYGMRFNIGPVQQERWLAAALPQGDASGSSLVAAKAR
jgi:hypothetical protein